MHGWVLQIAIHMSIFNKASALRKVHIFTLATFVH